MTETNQETFVQRWFVLPKLLYFWLSLAIYSAMGTFGNLLKKDWGFTNSQVGFVMALQGINFVGAIVWTGAADRTGKHKWLLAGATLISAILFLVNNFPKIIKYAFPNKYYQMAFTFASLGCSWFFQSAMFPLLDSAMIGMLAKNPKFTKDQFGNQRVFGSPAHLAGTMLGAYFQSFDKDKAVYFYSINAFICASVFIILVILAVPNVEPGVPKAFAHHGHHEKGKPAHLSQATALPLAPSPVMPAAPEIDTTPTKTESSPVVRLLTNVPFLFFMLFVVSAGLLANTLTLYQQILVAERHKSAGHEDKGVLKAAYTRAPAVVSEIIVYLSAKHVTKALGIYWLLIFSQLAGLIRIFGYAFVHENDIAPYFWEITKGLNSGFIVSAGVRIASDIALPGTSTTAQGLFSGTYKGISISIAGIAGALILLPLNQDLSRLFMIIGAFSTFTTIAFFLKFLLIDRVIGFPGFPRKEKVPVLMHDTPSTSSFGSVTSDNKESSKV